MDSFSNQNDSVLEMLLVKIDRDELRVPSIVSNPLADECNSNCFV